MILCLLFLSIKINCCCRCDYCVKRGDKNKKILKAKTLIKPTINNISSNQQESNNKIFPHFRKPKIKDKKLKIDKKYLDIIGLYSDEVKTLNEVTDTKLNQELIIRHLKISDAIKELDKSINLKSKILKIIEIICNDVKNKTFTYENSNLIMPRCLVEYENNNCILVAHLVCCLGSPVVIKQYLLFNYLFLTGELKKEDSPLLFEFCKFFENAINKPNFSDKIKCFSILQCFYDKYKDNKYWKQKNRNGKNLVSGSFQSNDLYFFLSGQISKDIQNLINHKDKQLKLFSPIAETFVNVGKLLFQKNKNLHNIDLTKDSNGDICASILVMRDYHIYAFRNINDTIISYDSYNIMIPKPISKRYFLKLRLNEYLCRKNFNTDYLNINSDIIAFH